MANVYVSSTFQDLEDYRAKVLEALRSNRHIDIAMEHYGAQNRRPLDKCLEDVANCDLYVGLFAWRYGYIPNNQTKSITELEFEQAIKTKRPRLIFVARKSKWDLELMEMERYQEIVQLRQRVMSDRIVAEFSSIDELYGKLVSALMEWNEQQGFKAGQPILDWARYLKNILREHGPIRLNVIAGPRRAEVKPPPLVDVFVPQLGQAKLPIFDVPESVLESRREQFDQPREEDETNNEYGVAASEEIVDETDIGEEIPEGVFEVIGRERAQVIVGSPGMGKTTLIHYLMLRLSGAGEQTAIPSHLKTVPLPFLIELRQYLLSKSEDFVDYIIANIAARYDFQIERDQLEKKLNEQGGAIVFFDGLDEVFQQASRAEVIEKFKAFSRCYPNCRLVVSTRIAGYEPTELQLADFRHYTLLDFNIQQANTFIRRWYTFYTWQGDERNAAGLIQRISENPRLRELAGNPLLLTIMAILYKHQDLPEKRWELYRQATSVLLEDWDIKRKKLTKEELMPLPEGVRIGKDQKARLLQRVSYYMLERSQPNAELNAIAYHQLITIVAEFLETEYRRPPGEARDLAAEILNHLRERTYILAEIGEQIYGFVHRTFMEYFAASHIEYEFYNRKSDYSWLTKKVYGAHWKQDQWREILLLLIAMIADRGSPVEEVIEHLDTIRKKRPLYNTVFAAECLAEAGSPNQLLAGRLFEKLAGEIIAMIKSKAPTYRNFIDEALRVFAHLATTAVVPEQISGTVKRLKKINTDRSRVAAWDLEFAMKAGEARFLYALAAAKSDDKEAIRSGALLVLEREWPGRTKVREVLLETLRTSKYVRSQQVAMDILERGWPNDPEILDTIESRLGKRISYTIGARFIDYLARRWRNDERAFWLSVSIAGSKFKQLQSDDVQERIEQHTVGAIARGWADRIDLVLRLEAEANDRRQRIGRRALFEGWPEMPETGKMLKAALRPDLQPQERVELAANLRIAKPDDREITEHLLNWALGQLADDKSEELTRLYSLMAAAVYAPGPFFEFLRNNIANIHSATVRAAAICFCFGSYDLNLINGEHVELNWIYEWKGWVHDAICGLVQLIWEDFEFLPILDGWDISIPYSNIYSDLLVSGGRPVENKEVLLWMSSQAESDPAPLVRFAIMVELVHFNVNLPLVQSLLVDREANDANQVIRSLATVLRPGPPPGKYLYTNWDIHMSEHTFYKPMEVRFGWIRDRLK